MGDESLFYRPGNPLLGIINTYLGGPTPSRRDDPAIRFDLRGVEYHFSYGRGPTTRLAWKDIRAVAVMPGPVSDRQGLCVYPFAELPEQKDATSVLHTGSGPGFAHHLNRLFGTPIAVHWHHVRGPSLTKLGQRLPAWTDGRITLSRG